MSQTKKIVVIFSENNDESTNRVIDWLTYFKVEFIRDNAFGNSNILKTTNIISFYLNKSKKQKWNIDSNNFTNVNQDENISIWFRRPVNIVGGIFQDFPYIGSLSSKKIKNSLREHYEILKEYLAYKLADGINNIGSFNITQLNKPITLELAKKNDLDIPDTLITNSQIELLKFIELKKKIICKPLHEVYIENSDELSYITYTKLINPEKDITSSFGVSLFQKYIPKLFEIRSFYLNGEFYSMAIFSQKNKKTRVDFRTYDHKKMNRMIPYSLDCKIESKLTNLMNDLKLNSGSIDLIYSTNNIIYFLEVNPIGQYDFLSRYCNYHLHKKIAEKLS